MAYCSKALGGLSNDCARSKGGIKKVFITTKNPMPITLTKRDIPEIIDDFDYKDGRWYEYNFKKNTSSMSSTLNIDPTNGVNYVQTDVSLQFNRMDAVKRTEMRELAKGGLYMVVVDNNDTYWYLGIDNFVDATSGSGQSGTNFGDGNFYQITLTDISKFYPIPLSETAKEFINQGGSQYAKLVLKVRTRNGQTPLIGDDYGTGDLIFSYKAYDKDGNEIGYKIDSTNASAINDVLSRESQRVSAGLAWSVDTTEGHTYLTWCIDFYTSDKDSFLANVNYPLIVNGGDVRLDDEVSDLTIEIN